MGYAFWLNGETRRCLKIRVNSPFLAKLMKHCPDGGSICTSTLYLPERRFPALLVRPALSVRYLLPCRRTRCPVSAPLKWSPFTPIRGTVISECCESDDQRLSQKALLSFVLVRARPVLTSICGGVLCTFLVDAPVAGCPGTCSFVWSRRSALFQGWDGGHSVGQCATFTFAQRDTQFVTEVWTA